MASKVPVIIINYKNPKNTLQCLDSLQRCINAKELRPIVVDTGDDQIWSQKLSVTFGDWVTYLPQKENLGFSGANNVGIEYAQSKYSPEFLILLNDDTTVAPESLSQLLSTLRENPEIGAVVPKIYFSKGKEFHTGYLPDEQGKVIWYAGGVIDWKDVVGFHRGVDEVDRGQFSKSEVTEFATGCCVAFRTQALREAGNFDERYFLYLEDVDLSQRILAKGWQLRFEPEAVIWHDNAGSSASGSRLHEYYFVRNRYLFGFRYAPLRTRLFLLKHLVIQWLQGSEVTKQAVQDFLIGNYGKRDALHQ